MSTDEPFSFTLRPASLDDVVTMQHAVADDPPPDATVLVAPSSRVRPGWRWRRGTANW